MEWMVEQVSRVNGAVNYRVIDEDTAIVADVKRDYEGEDALAIARLIAAAPTLLAALKDITPTMPPMNATCHVGMTTQDKCAHCRRIAAALAAIAKAAGL